MNMRDVGRGTTRRIAQVGTDKLAEEEIPALASDFIMS
jgi:hypothetical protein